MGAFISRHRIMQGEFFVGNATETHRPVVQHAEIIILGLPELIHATIPICAALFNPPTTVATQTLNALGANADSEWVAQKVAQPSVLGVAPHLGESHQNPNLISSMTGEQGSPSW